MALIVDGKPVDTKPLRVNADPEVVLTEVERRKLFDMAMEPLRQSTPFDFGQSDLLDRLRDRGLALGAERDLAHVPPAATLFLHRKIAGTYLMAARLGARVALRPMVERYP